MWFYARKSVTKPSFVVHDPVYCVTIDTSDLNYIRSLMRGYCCIDNTNRHHKII